MAIGGWLMADTAERLVPSPVFVLSSMRSGSTLLRVLLDSHSQLHAPHELHLRGLQVELAEQPTELAMTRLGLDREQLEHLLWDRLLHWQLHRSGKQIIVDKTPANALRWDRLHRCWPQARFVFLLRHPASVLSSLCELSPAIAPEKLVPVVLSYFDGIEAARTGLTGHTIRYEQLVADPAAETARLCAFLGVGWQAEMLEYGRFDHGTYEMFLGDFTGKIRSGRIGEARPLPEPGTVPSLLQEACKRWDYLV